MVFMGMNYVIGRLLRGFNWPICCADGQNVKATRRCGNSTGKSTCRSKTLLMVNSRLNTRPISIQSAICRTIATALAQKDEVKQWVQQHVTPEVHGGVSGRGVHTAVLALASSFQHEHAVLLSLDMKKGYDYADPELVVGHLRRRGLPEHWCQYFAHVWMEQYRWLEWDNHVCPEPEFVSRSLPQGDPFAVLGFVLLLSEAASAARQNASQDEVCALFVDDRTVVVREPRFLQGAFRFWIAWSRRLGFEENLDNLAIVCANPSDEEVVLAQGFEANAVVRQAKVLGVDFQQRGLDSEGRTAETRRKDGLAILQRLRKAPVAVVTKEVLASTRALPRACCGVWFRHFEDSSKFGTQVKYAVQAHRNGSRNLWELFFGPAANPAMYSLQQSFSYLARGMRYWHGQGRQYQGGLWWISLMTSLRGLGLATRTAFSCTVPWAGSLGPHRGMQIFQGGSSVVATYFVRLSGVNISRPSWIGTDGTVDNSGMLPYTRKRGSLVPVPYIGRPDMPAGQ